MTNKVVIVGAGIGGLTAALALVKRGMRVSIFEQAKQIQEVGAGLQLSPNAVHVLNALGLRAALQAVIFQPEYAVMRHYQSARAYFSVPLGQRCEQKFAAPYWHVHRADLHQVLYQACLAHGVEFRLAAKVAAYQHSNSGAQVSVQLTDGEQLDADVLIGADGIHSVIQQQVLQAHGLSSQPRFTGQVAWRGTIEAKRLPPKLVEPNANLWVGPGKHLVSYYLRGGKLVNFVAVEERSDWQLESWSQPGDVAQLQALFSDWHPQVRELIGAAERCFSWALHDRAPLTHWVDKRVALLGDACHPMLPFLAQGAAMAIEDAYVLAAMLARQADPEQALQLYQQARFPRCTMVQQGAKQNTSLYHRSGMLDNAKLAVLAALADSGISNWLAAKQLERLYHYNPVAEFQTELANGN